MDVVAVIPARLVLWALVVGALVLVCLPDAEAGHVRRACPHHVTRGTEARERYVRCEVDRIWPGHRALVAATFRCEAGPDMLDPYGGDGYAGPGQHDVDLWAGRFRTWGRGNHPGDGRLRNDPGAFRPGVIVSVRMMRAVGAGPPHWPNCP